MAVRRQVVQKNRWKPKDFTDQSGGDPEVVFGLLKGFTKHGSFLKGMSLLNTDSDFAAHLLSLEMSRLQRSVMFGCRF